MFTPWGLPDIGEAGTGMAFMSPHVVSQDSPFLPGRVVGLSLGHTAGIQAVFTRQAFWIGTWDGHPQRMCWPSL